MKLYLSFAYFLLFCSCSTLKIDSGKNERNTPSLGLDWQFDERVNESLQPQIDSIMNAEIDQFNSQKHSFTLHKKNKKDKDYLNIEFLLAKKVSKGEKAAGYIVSGIGLIGAPVALIAANAGFVIAFYYWPENKIDTKISYSDNLADPNSKGKKYEVVTGGLFANEQKQVDKLLSKFINHINIVLLNTDKQLQSHQ